MFLFRNTKRKLNFCHLLCSLGFSVLSFCGALGIYCRWILSIRATEWWPRLLTSWFSAVIAARRAAQSWESWGWLSRVLRQSVNQTEKIDLRSDSLSLLLIMTEEEMEQAGRWLTSSAHHFHPCVMAWCLKQILGLTYLSVTTPDDESSLRQWSKLKVNPLWIFGQLLIDSIVSHCISQRQEKLLIVVKH